MCNFSTTVQRVATCTIGKLIIVPLKLSECYKVLFFGDIQASRIEHCEYILQRGGTQVELWGAFNTYR